MTNRYFHDPVEPYEHHRIRAWREYLCASGVARMEVEIRQVRSGIGRALSILVVDFLSASGEVQRVDEVSWELELDTWLAAQGVCARSHRTEALRASLRLGGRFDTLARQYSFISFNASLLRAVSNGPLGEERGVMAVVQQIRLPPDKTDRTVKRGIGEVDLTFCGLAGELMRMGYERPVAERIFADAVAMYLDERFHVSERHELFGR